MPSPSAKRGLRETCSVQSPSRNLRLYGTEEAPAASQDLSAGQLSLQLQAGALRHICLGDQEVIRSIAFLVRDENWGTYIPQIFDLEIAQDGDSFCISYCAECRDGEQILTYTVRVDGAADGALEFVVCGAAKSLFVTSRTGFVVLHPVDGVAGQPVVITHTDESDELSHFPSLISPSQPMFDVRALTHEIAPGVELSCRMEGDAFEMEDQRNWSDASYKTYIRPLSKPHPYILQAGQAFTQRVVLGVKGSLAANSNPQKGRGCGVSVRQKLQGRLPEFALAVHGDHVEPITEIAKRIVQTKVGYIVCTFDLSAGHDAETMAMFKRLGDDSGAKLILEAALPLRDKSGQYTDDERVLNAELAAVSSAAAVANVEFEIVSIAPLCYYKSFQPIDNWPSAPPLDRFYAAVRRTFPESGVAGGMHSYFTELNRRPPPPDAIDVVTHSTSPIVHASDDSSVMESLQSLPWIFRSVHKLAPGKPYWIGPTALGMRFNPYGATTMPNPENLRGAMVTLDPRQRGLFNAAWTLGYVARAAAGDVAGLCLSSVAGPSGIAWQKAEWAQPWFDEIASHEAVFPVFHVLAGLAPRAGAKLRAVDLNGSTALAAVAIDSSAGQELWLANLTAEQQQVELHGVGVSAVVATLDAETFETCCAGAEGFAATAETLVASTVTLRPYSVLRISSE